MAIYSVAHRPSISASMTTRERGSSSCPCLVVTYRSLHILTAVQETNKHYVQLGSDLKLVLRKFLCASPPEGATSHQQGPLYGATSMGPLDGATSRATRWGQSRGHQQSSVLWMTKERSSARSVLTSPPTREQCSHLPADTPADTRAVEHQQEGEGGVADAARLSSAEIYGTRREIATASNVFKL